MNRKKLIYGMIVFATFILLSCNENNEKKTTLTKEQINANSKKANEFFNRCYYELLYRSPMQLSRLGFKRDEDKWDDVSEQEAQKVFDITKRQLQSLKDSFKLEELDSQTQLSYKLFVRKAENNIEAFPYRFNNYPVNQEEGLHTGVPDLLINVHTIDNLEDAKAYISRVSKVKDLFQMVVENLEIRKGKGIIAPQFVFPKVIKACQEIIKGSPFVGQENNPVYEDFSNKIAKAKFPKTTSDSLLKELENAMLTVMKPAYEMLIEELKTLEKSAPKEGGAWSMPDGTKYYELACRLNTTTNMTPEEIYQLGLKEVARIQGEIKEIMKKTGHEKQTVSEFMRWSTTAPQFFYEDNAKGQKEYLQQATAYIDGMRTRLDELFITKPKAPIVVWQVEKFRESSAGTAFYEAPSLDGKRPGRFYANLSQMNAAPNYQLEALAYHEGIPGHHMQVAIAQELQGVPEFRKFIDFTSYVEGWALYCELVPKQLGFYKDIWSDYGRLTMELLRAARLVVDPGIHLKHWTRQQAIDYFKANTAEPDGECEHAIERYTVWPGQATAYKIGMNKILELRTYSQKELGDKFSIREFHDLILTSGALPMDILEGMIKDYVKGKKEK